MPIFHDEIGHWAQAEAVFRAGHPFVPNTLIPIIQWYPGLEELTASIQNLTGMSTFQVAEALLWLLHAVALIGIFILAERLAGSSRAAGIASLLYAVNPAFTFFNSQFAYESLAIVFFIWVLVCVTCLQVARPRDGHRLPWFLVGLVLAAACIVTHHLSTYALILALLIICTIAVVRFRRTADSRRRVWLTIGFTALVVAGAGAWLAFVAPETIGYLLPYPSAGVAALAQLLGHHSAARQLFKGSSVPAYEQLAAFATPIILFGLLAGSVLQLWRRRRLPPPGLLGLAVFGLLYFASLPFILTPDSSGASRSWAYSYVGLAVLLSPFLVSLLRRGDLSYAGRPASRAALVIIVMTLLIGNVSLDVNVEYRFPGPYVYDSDSRDLTPELLASASWFRESMGANNDIVTDKDTGLAFGPFGRQKLAVAWKGFPDWELYFRTGLPSAALIHDLSKSSYHYLIVDTEMYHNLPEVGIYFEFGEPGAYDHPNPPPVTALAKFASLPWLTEIYSTQHIRIYRIDMSEFESCPADPQLPVALLPGCRASQ
jgi:hypothetical protein